MFDDIFQIGADNWIFVYYVKDKNKYKVCFFKNIHSKIHIVQYDDIFITLEGFKTNTLKEIKDIVNQFTYQFKKKV